MKQMVTDVPFVLQAFLVLWIPVSLLWAPCLTSNRVRAVFEQGPTGSLVLNYLAILGVVSGVHALAFVVGGVLIGQGIAIVQWAVALSVLVPAGGWFAVVRVFPDSEWGRRIHARELSRPLAVCAMWYAVITVLVVVVLFLFLMFSNIPL